MKTTAGRFIRRPTVPRGPGRPGAGYPYAELLETLDTNRALLLPGPRATVDKVVRSMRRNMHRHKYRMRVAEHPDGLAVWIEARDGTTASTA